MLTSNLAIEALRQFTGKIAAVDVRKILGMSQYQITQDDNYRLGAIMQELGWEPALQRFGGPPIRAYVRGTPAERKVAIYVFVDPITGEVTVRSGR